MSIRPTRGFRNSKEISQIEDELLETYKVYTHTFAYLYINQDNEIKEYKVAYKGEAYNETFLDIYYIDENGLSLNFIPIEKDSEIKISYSNFKLDKNKDKKLIDKLHKIKVNPKNLDKKTESFYSSNKNSMNFRSLDIKNDAFKSYLEYKPDFINDVNINIFCVIDDILGEIEDRYFELEDSFKNAYTINNSYIAKVQEINNYPITMISILEYFYSTDEEDKLLETLEDKYKELVKIYLSNEDMIKNIFEKDSGKLDWIFEKDIFDTGLAYILKFKQVKYNFFEEFNIEPENGNQFIYYNINKNSFETIKTIKSLNNFSYHTKESKYHTSNSVFLDNSDSKYTLVKNSANELLAGVIFATVYSQKFDELLNENILNIAKELEDILKQLRVKPYLDEARKDNLRKVVDENEIYKDILSFSSKREKDSYLDDYASLEI